MPRASVLVAELLDADGRTARHEDMASQQATGGHDGDATASQDGAGRAASPNGPGGNDAAAAVRGLTARTPG